MYGVAQTRTRLLGRRTLSPQAVKQVLSECAIPTSRQNLLQIQYLTPKPDVASCACAARRLNFPAKNRNYQIVTWLCNLEGGMITLRTLLQREAEGVREPFELQECQENWWNLKAGFELCENGPWQQKPNAQND